MVLTTTQDIDKRMKYKEIQESKPGKTDNVVSKVKVVKVVQKQKQRKIISL